MVLTLFLSWKGSAQNLSNRGREFWVGYGHHQFMEPGQSNTQEMVLYFSAEQAASVKVTVKGRAGTLVKTYPVPANTVIASDFMPKAGTLDCRLYDLPPSFGGTGGEGLYDLSIHIESDVPIVAYSHTFGSASSGATMLIPVETYGHQYYSLNSTQVYQPNCFSWAYVVAAYDNTVVEITPSVQTRTGKPANVPFRVNLSRGQIYQVIGANLTGGSTSLELTGTRFRSVANASGDCYPVAVFSGSSRTSNPISCGSGGGDNDNQQCFPTQSWGKRYLTAPLSSSNGASTFQRNSFRVLVKDPTTVVTRNGVALTGLQRNSFYFFESNTADEIVADKPIMVAQYMTGGSCLNGSLGDPEMIYLSPVEQGIKRVGFYRNTREAITVNYLTLVIPTAGVSSLRIDGSPAFDHTYPHPNAAGYTVVVKRWTAQARQATASSDSAFTAVTYGLGSVESYGYNAGTFINNLSARSGLQNIPDTAAKAHAFTCVNTPVKLSALMAAYQPTRIDWNLSKLGSVISPNTDVRVDNPVPVDTVYVNGIRYWRYELPGTYTFSKADTIFIPISGYHPSIENCYTREDLSIPVVVKAKPSADFTFSHTGCTRDTIFFRAKDTTSNGYVNRDFAWIMPGNRRVLSTRVDTLLPPGSYAIRFGVVTRDGCASDTIKTVTISDKPSAGFVTTPESVCMGTGFQFRDTASSAITVNKWYWQFGNGRDSISTTGPTLQYLYPAPGEYTVKHVSSSSPTCISDTVTRKIVVYALPSVSFTNDANGCIAPDGKVTFKATGTTPDGQTMANWLWNFGDAAATPTNPNTGSGVDTSHLYRSGTYSIKLTGVTARGCTKDTVMSLTFKLKPALTFARLDSVCQSAPALSIAKATVSNGVTGTGTYKGPGTTAAGQFDPKTAGPGLHTIIYVFKTADNCEDSVSTTIRVWASPVASFTIAAAGCLPPDGRVRFTGTSVSPDNQSLTYLWDFGDANATPSNPNTSTIKDPTHDFREGTYNIKLTATNFHGCARDTIITAKMNLKPVLAFDPLTPICQQSASFTIAKGRVTNGLAGSFVYRGPGTSSNGSFDPRIAGPGTHTIWYEYTTNGGCTDSISQTLQINANPVAAFTIPAPGCLPANGRVNFTNTTLVADNQALTYAWNFGDASATPGNPNTSTLKDPSHDYAEGTFNIKLTATGISGCADDTIVVAKFALRPVLQASTLSELCESTAPVSAAFASVTNGVAGNGNYKGPGMVSGFFDPKGAGFGNHTIWYLFTTAGGCTDSISQTIRVNASPKAVFTIPGGACLEPNGRVNFSNLSQAPDGLALTWLWNFGDANATPGNPNTSTSKDPSHDFREGAYAVKLTATSAKGCAKDTTVNYTFGLKPVLTFGSLTPVCEGTPSATIARGQVTNGVNGTGIYKGPGTNAAGMFDPTVAGSGTHTIWFVFTSAGGCTDSIAQTVEVYPRPVSSFSVTAGICAGKQVTITNSATIPSGAIASWQWDLADGNTPSSSNGNAFNHVYAAAGTYKITLVTKSLLGCVSLPAEQTVLVSPTPKVAFTLPTSVCFPGNPAVFTNTSTVGDNSGLSHVWDFGDGSPTSTTVNGSRIYSTIGTYSVKLTATSGKGCVDSARQSFGAFFGKPVAALSVDARNICQGVDTRFSDRSTDAGSTITGWAWTFGDGTVSTSRNPVKRYSLPGTYVVSLAATNAGGCVSDPVRDTVRVFLQPVVDAGPSFVVQQGTRVTFQPKVNDTTLRFTWSPAPDLSPASLLRASVTANQDQIYRLTAIGQNNCTASDTLTVRILKPVKVPNAFSPNGDGVHDTWNIEHISDYPGSSLQVFNRYGQLVYSIKGYSTPWDGRANGKDLPVGVYYYIIELRNGFSPLNGSITIIR